MSWRVEGNKTSDILSNNVDSKTSVGYIPNWMLILLFIARFRDSKPPIFLKLVGLVKAIAKTQHLPRMLGLSTQPTVFFTARSDVQTKRV